MSLSRSALPWMVIALAALVDAASAAAPEPAGGGRLIASQTRLGGARDETLSIHRVTPGGLELPHQESGRLHGFGWSDAHTLWVLRVEAKGMSIAKLVDGKPLQKTPVTGADWKLPYDPDDFDISLLAASDQGVWLERRCPTCAAPQCLRVDVRPYIPSTRRPNFGTGPAYGFTATQAPAGYEVKLVTPPAQPTAAGSRFRSAKTRALFNDKTTLTCSGPDGKSLQWPDATTEQPALHPRGVTWVRTSPPLVRITGKRVHPNGDVTDAELFILGCSNVLDDALNFGGGYWAAFRDDATGGGMWTIYRDEKTIGKVPGALLRPAPPPSF